MSVEARHSRVAGGGEQLVSDFTLSPTNVLSGLWSVCGRACRYCSRETRLSAALVDASKRGHHATIFLASQRLRQWTEFSLLSIACTFCGTPLRARGCPSAVGNA